VSSNVNGAQVTINGNTVGTTPFSAQVPNGSYNIDVQADGYSDFQNTYVVNNGPLAIDASLQLVQASWIVKFSDQALGRNPQLAQMRGIRIFVDGMQQPEVPGPTIAQGQFAPGQHSIRMVLGAFALETQLVAQAGRTYFIEPALTVRE
jgi:hypothetical protein